MTESRDPAALPPEPNQPEVLPPPGLIGIVDQLVELAATAPRVPWSSRAVLDADELSALVTELRARLPSDLEEARDIIAARAVLLSDAEVAARDLLAEAEAEADRLVRHHTITRAADERAARILTEAEQKAAQLLADARQEAADLLAETTAQAERQIAEADAYSLDVLRRIEEQLTGFVVSVRKGIDSLEGSAERRSV